MQPRLSVNADGQPNRALTMVGDERFQLSKMKSGNFKQTFLGEQQGMFGAFQKSALHKPLAAKCFLAAQLPWRVTVTANGLPGDRGYPDLGDRSKCDPHPDPT